MDSALRMISATADRVSRAVGRSAAWLYPLLVVVLIVNVALRYGIGRGFIELEELQWHLFGAAFLLGFAYTYAEDEHVRVDLIHARLSERTRAAIELFGCLILLLPFTIIVGAWAFDFFITSFQMGERSPMPSGLPARFIIKGILFIAIVLLGFQALGRAAQSLLVLRGRT